MFGLMISNPVTDPNLIPFIYFLRGEKPILTLFKIMFCTSNKNTSKSDIEQPQHAFQATAQNNPALYITFHKLDRWNSFEQFQSAKMSFQAWEAKKLPGADPTC